MPASQTRPKTWHSATRKGKMALPRVAAGFLRPLCDILIGSSVSLGRVAYLWFHLSSISGRHAR